MSRSHQKLVSLALSTTITALFFGAIFPLAYAGYSLPLPARLNAKQGGSPYNIIRDLTVGAQGDDVKTLQRFLNSHGAQVSKDGPGSPGMETGYFGGATRAALARWQAAHGIVPSAGYFGPISRSAITKAAEDTPLSLSPPQSLSSPVSSEEATLSGPPVRLKIPAINVDAAVEYVGLTQDGAMAVPKDPKDVGWFNLGSRPGEIGSAVIAGHWGWKNGIPAVFDFLHKLQKGDRIYVADEKGTLVAFVVREIRTLGENADASSVFGSNDGKAHLNLITCEGTWNKSRKSYSDRLVVFTDKELI